MQQLDRTGALEAGHLLFTVYRVAGDNPFLHGGEIGTLQWDRVDMVKQRVSIDRVIDRIGKENAKLPKMQILFTFPNLYPGTKTSIMLKQPKTEGSIREIDVPASTMQALAGLRELQENLKKELGPRRVC